MKKLPQKKSSQKSPLPHRGERNESAYIPLIAAFLADAGYGDLSIGAALATLSSHLTCGEALPHEIGVFLGYPLEDVLAFIRHRGQGCGLCGCWKAYHNLPEAARIFALYDRCRRIYTRLHTGGRSLEQLTVAA